MGIKVSKNGGKYITIQWFDEDVICQADDIGEKLTDDEVEEVLYLLENKHDATLGISWETISFWIQEIVKDRTGDSYVLGKREEE